MGRAIKKNIIVKNPDYEAMEYCFKKGFVINPEPITFETKEKGKKVTKMTGQYKIKYQLGHKYKYYMNDKLFEKDEVHQAIWDLFKKIYEHDKTRNNGIS